MFLKQERYILTGYEYNHLSFRICIVRKNFPTETEVNAIFGKELVSTKIIITHKTFSTPIINVSLSNNANYEKKKRYPTGMHQIFTLPSSLSKLQEDIWISKTILFSIELSEYYGRNDPRWQGVLSVAVTGRVA